MKKITAYPIIPTPARAISEDPHLRAGFSAATPDRMVAVAMRTTSFWFVRTLGGARSHVAAVTKKE
jgi:hypothetical protein